MSLGVDDHEGIQVLIRDIWSLLVEGLDRFTRCLEKTSFPQNMGFPPAFDDLPVGIVAIHGNFHPPAAGRNLIIQALFIRDLLEFLLGRCHVIEGRSFAHVTAVEEGMDAYPPTTRFRTPLDQPIQVVDVGVDIPVG